MKISADAEMTRNGTLYYLNNFCFENWPIYKKKIKKLEFEPEIFQNLKNIFKISIPCIKTFLYYHAAISGGFNKRRARKKMMRAAVAEKIVVPEL